VDYLALIGTVLILLIQLAQEKHLRRISRALRPCNLTVGARLPFAPLLRMLDDGEDP
jgi:hypothetical protein